MLNQVTSNAAKPAPGQNPGEQCSTFRKTRARRFCGMLTTPKLANQFKPMFKPYAGKKGAYFPTLKLYPSTALGCASLSFISYWSLDWVSRCLGVTRCILCRRSGIPSTVCVCMYLTGTHHTNSNTACFCCYLLCLLCSLLYSSALLDCSLRYLVFLLVFS